MTLAYARLIPGLERHTKVLQASAIVASSCKLAPEIADAVVLAALVRIWSHAAAFQPDGAIGPLEVVARIVAQPRARARRVVSALAEARLLDLHGDVHVIHGWEERYAEALDERERARARWRRNKQAKRGHVRDVRADSEDVSARTSEDSNADGSADVRAESTGVPSRDARAKVSKCPSVQVSSPLSPPTGGAGVDPPRHERQSSRRRRRQEPEPEQAPLDWGPGDDWSDLAREALDAPRPETDPARRDPPPPDPAP